jgi:hypothetical protein
VTEAERFEVSATSESGVLYTESDPSLFKWWDTETAPFGITKLTTTWLLGQFGYVTY